MSAVFFHLDRSRVRNDHPRQSPSRRSARTCDPICMGNKGSRITAYSTCGVRRSACSDHGCRHPDDAEPGQHDDRAYDRGPDDDAGSRRSSARDERSLARRARGV